MIKHCDIALTASILFVPLKSRFEDHLRPKLHG
jgi:hypothetical protein